MHYVKAINAFIKQTLPLNDALLYRFLVFT
jgi:hypothetical protein